jgi:hypothetical protein
MKGWASSYYELPEGATELMDLIEYRGMSFAVGNIFKAAYRLGNKEGTTAEYDLRKIIWFAQRELDRIESEKVWGVQKEVEPANDLYVRYQGRHHCRV